MWCSTNIFCFHNNKGFREKKRGKKKLTLHVNVNLHVHACTLYVGCGERHADSGARWYCVHQLDKVVRYCVHQWGRVVLCTPVGQGDTVYTSGTR